MDVKWKAAKADSETTKDNTLETSEPENYRSQRDKGKGRTKEVRPEERKNVPLAEEAPGRGAYRTGGKAGQGHLLWSWSPSKTRTPLGWSPLPPLAELEWKSDTTAP